MSVDFLVSEVQVSNHRGRDDLLSAGLGLFGLRLPPPALDDPLRPSASALRRRAIHTGWTGIADLSPRGGYGEIYGAVPSIPGREYHAFARLPGARQPHRVLLQAPDAFDRKARCLVVSASSGSRGIYGAQALASAFALPRGCAVVHTDKGTGSGYWDSADGSGVGLDGRRMRAGSAPLEFEPQVPPSAGIGVKHAHSRDHPEAAWGEHVLQAVRFGLALLDEAYPQLAPFTAGNTRIIATGLSNGGGAVLQAAGIDADGLIDAVVAIEPNVHVQGGRALFDYATEAALWLPGALANPRLAGAPMAAAAQPAGVMRCATLHARGLVSGADPAAQAAQALHHLQAQGWTLPVLRAAAVASAFDLWRAIASAYASAYLRADIESMPCGLRYRTRVAMPAVAAALRAGWWADGSGLPPGNGIVLTDGNDAILPDPHWQALACLRGLWEGKTDDAMRLRRAVAEVETRLPRPELPVWVVHGALDGLIPARFSSDPYVQWLERHGRQVHYWQVAHGQHFDALLGLPGLGEAYVPLLPYAYVALEQMYRHVVHGQPLRPGPVPQSRPRGVGQLEPASLGLAR